MELSNEYLLLILTVIAITQISVIAIYQLVKNNRNRLKWTTPSVKRIHTIEAKFLSKSL